MQQQCVVYEVADDYQQKLAAKRCYTEIVPQGLLCCALERLGRKLPQLRASDVLSSEALHKAYSPCGFPAERAARHGLCAAEFG